MKKNMSRFDREIRVLVALAIVALYLTNIIGGTLAIILGILAAVFFLTSLAGSCPLYTLFGISSSRNKRDMHIQK